MNKYKVTFEDVDTKLQRVYTCKCTSPMYALIKAEEHLRLHGWLDNICDRIIQIERVS